MLWTMVAVALLPIAGAVARVSIGGWVPEGDDAMIARRSMAVLSTDPPLSGQPSTASSLFEGDEGADPVNASHPGPAQYWLLALPYRAFGWSPTGLLVAVGLVNAASAASVVWLAWRRLGPAGAVAGAVAVLVVAQRMGPFQLARPLNATAVVLPLLAGLVATWAALCRDRLAVVPAVVLLSLVVQSHLGVLTLGSVALVTAVAGGAWTWWRRPTRRWALPAATALSLVAAWGPVLVEQLTADPGNLTRMVEVAGAPVERAGFTFGVTAVLDQVIRLVVPGGGQFPQVAVIGPLDQGRAALRGLVLVAGLAAGAVAARRWGDRDRARLLAVVAAAIVIAATSLSVGPTSVRVGAQYQVAWLTALTGLAWFTAVAFVAPPLARWVDDLGDRRARVPATARRTLVVVATATAVVIPATGASFDRAANDRTAALVAAVRDEVPPGTYVVAASGNWAYLSTLDAVALDLLRRGDDVRLVRLGELPDEPRRRDLDVDAPTIVIDSLDQQPDGGDLLARFGPVPEQRRWGSDVLAAVASPSVELVVPAEVPATLGDDPRSRAVLATAQGPDTPERRRRVAEHLLATDHDLRTPLLDHLEFRSLDAYWVERLAARLPAPYPQTGLAAWLVPPG